MDASSVSEHGKLFIRYRDERDPAAFERIMELYHLPLFHYLLRMLRKKEDAEDALQEVWLKVIRQRSSYCEQGRFSSWLYRIAHNYCLDLFRKRNYRPDEEEMSETSDGYALLDGVASEYPTPHDLAVDNEVMSRVEKEVDCMPEAIREVFLLRIVHGVPFKQIAEIQDSPLGTVLSRMHQAVKRLQAAIPLVADNSVVESA
ncbi:MAG: sigma-70 family RNA polymerase sigma factor [Candidatus Omnitrophota bacterium]|jgi:RNA polymerase sigma-70 factor (ECF subfamily)|nr:MAG: sigma-70 family RNA polymerase sigma factor [Candidatus Omnitrophota bacterium]